MAIEQDRIPRYIVGRTVGVIVKAVPLMPACSIYLWWAYSMGSQVSGGFRTYSQVIVLAIEMSILTTALTAIVWLVSPSIHRQLSWVGLAIRTALETALVLVLYVALVVLWRQAWTPEKGMSESAAFMPIVGHINAEFFAEEGWLEYLIVVIPFVSLLSGVLASSFDFLQEPGQLQRSGKASADSAVDSQPVNGPEDA